MSKRILLKLAMILSLMLVIPVVPVAKSQPPRPHQIIIATIGEPETADPAWLYDTASAELCQNIYDTLIFFNVTRDADGDIVNRTTSGKTNEFVPAVAEALPVVKDISETDPETGLTWVQRWYFKIRSGVLFHDGTTTLTPQDVEYSFERWMVQCRSGGPTWMILEPTLGIYNTRSKMQAKFGNATLGKMIDHAVESNSTHVWFNLVMPYAPFPTIIAQSWAGILSYDWCIGLPVQVGDAPLTGDWPGTGVPFKDRWNYTYGGSVAEYTGWVYWNDPEVSPIDDAYSTSGVKPMGCGPYYFDYWSKAVEWQIKAFDNYYGGWPCPDLPTEATGNEITIVTEKFISEWATRKMMFLAGDVDFCYVPRMHLPEMIENWPVPPGEAEQYPGGIRCDKELPLLVCSPVLFFTYNISTTSPFMGVEGGLPPGTYSEGGIAPDFFDDIRVRKAFIYAFNYTRYLEEVYMGEASVCPTPIIEGLAFHNASITAPWFPGGNLTKAKELLQSIPELWNNGFTIGLSYNTGNVAREKACEMIKAAMEGPEIGNPKFHVKIYPVDWPTYLGHLVAGELTGFVLGWLADFPDAHNFAMPFMHPEGDFACFQEVHYGQSGRKQIRYYVNGVPYGDPTQVINNTYVAEMIENGVATTNETERQIIYNELQEIYVDECPSVPLCKPTGRHWERDWVQGWYHNPIYPGGYFYHYWKKLPGAWNPVDLSAVDTIANLTTVYPLVQVFQGEMLLRGEAVAIDYNLTVWRLDTYTTPSILHAGVALMRNNMTPTEYCIDYVVVKEGAVGFGLGPDSESITLTWNETEYVTTPFEESTWKVSGRVYVISGTEYDENAANDIVFDVHLVEAEVLVGDVTGDGEVDIFDAIGFAGHFGGGPDNPALYDPLYDLNGDGEIDIFDAILLAGNFGRTLP